MQRGGVLASVLAAMLAGAGASGADAAGAQLVPPLQGAHFGMTSSAWKALPVPTGADSTAAPICWSDKRPIRIPGYRPSAQEARTDLTTCAYVSRYGKDVFADSVPLDPRYRATSLRFLFDQGRLSQETFRASVDAYSDVMTLLTRRFGKPTATVRDSFLTSVGRIDRVRHSWRLGSGRVTLVDPSIDPTQLAVDIALAPDTGPVRRLAPSGR